MTVSELAKAPSNPVRGLEYGSSTSPTDFAPLEQMHGMGDGEPSLAGSGRPLEYHSAVVFEQVKGIELLLGVGQHQGGRCRGRGHPGRAGYAALASVGWS